MIRCVALILVFIAIAAHAGEVRVAVAANFSAPMRRIAVDFERATGHRAVLSSGATGKFYAQIRNGAPFGVLLAADAVTPARLEEEGFAVPGSRFVYATGRLVLWSARDGVVDDGGRVLRTGGFERLAVANPRLAPYGAAALEAMRALGVYDALAPRLVHAENIAQAYQFVATGNAQLGFVALSQVMEAGRPRGGSAWLLPASLHRPIRQEAVLLTAGRDNPAATALLDYLRGEPARAVIRAHGYEP